MMPNIRFTPLLFLVFSFFLPVFLEASAQSSPFDYDEVTETGAPNSRDKNETTEPGASAPEESSEATPPANEPFTVRWQNFLEATRALLYWDLFDGRFTIRGGASLQIDGTAGKANDRLEEAIGEIDATVKLRRFRVFAQGDLDHHLRYKLSIDLGADAGVKDFYMEGINDGLNVWGYDIGKFRLGSFGEPFSMERRTSRNSLVFLERSLPVWTFAPGRNVGYMLHDTAKEGRISWQAGFFSLGKNDEDNASASTLSVTGRLTWLPIFKDEGETLLHLGISFSSRDPRSNEVRFRSRPEARFVDFLVDTGPFDATKTQLTGFEFAYKQDQWWIHSELIRAKVNSSLYGDPDFWGGFVQAGYYLTGENRPYNQAEGIWGRLDPISGIDTGTPIRERRPFKQGRGGAFEIAARLSTLDLTDGAVTGGELTNLSIGLNWHPSWMTRWTLDYIYSKVKNGGHANIVLLRFQHSLY